ncbi:hypothetical protein L211DRAFT_702562 [Terfezia boudieri ATCC MYA-4762]|uniref:Uncharacterized protein n=1 Tax=Terfezia boudieri ATCC MYA-4762 TaxID=1051890 RepID=A0A3N4LYM1_9PEZI|nr:hypothetical protein L211DRAFT_702562 [Terfezia boudieri ATCC MYA-4762]
MTFKNWQFPRSYLSDHDVQIHYRLYTLPILLQKRLLKHTDANTMPKHKKKGVQQFTSPMNILQPTQNTIPLPFVRTDLPSEWRLAFREYILKILQLINQNGSYGVISCTTNHALIVLFGFPDLKDIILFEPAPYNIPILLRCKRSKGEPTSHPQPQCSPVDGSPVRWFQWKSFA